MFTFIIPLRAGSKRIPKKNVYPLNNIPLFCWTLNESLKSKRICGGGCRIVISTDDDDVKDIVSKQYKDYIFNGQIKILDRDPLYAEDGASTIDLILHDICEKDKTIDNIVILQATSPLRKSFHIDEALDIYINSKSESLVSLTSVKETPFWQYYINEKNIIKPIVDEDYKHVRFQDLPKTFMLNGALYISTKENIIKNNGFLGDNTIGYIMDKKYSVDIDTKEDLLYAKFLLDNKLV